MPTFRTQPVDVVLDVRSRIEFWLGHLDHAQCIPVHRIAEALPQRADIGKDARIMIYCASGARSAAAASTLRSLGYRRVVDAGGIGDAARDYIP